MDHHDVNPAAVLEALADRIGAANGISAAELARSLTGRTSAADQRRLRDCVVFLRLKGHAICALPEHGYFMAANTRELDASCRHLLNRAVTGLQQVYALKQRAMPDLAGQLGLALDDDTATSTEQGAHP